MIGSSFMGLYILDDQGQPVPVSAANESCLITWAQWFEHADRVVAQTPFSVSSTEEILVSTVFLGVDHGGGIGAPVLWETMVLGPQYLIDQLVDLSETCSSSIIALFLGVKDIQNRYTSQEEAQKGHRQMVEFVTVCLPKLRIGVPEEEAQP